MNLLALDTSSNACSVALQVGKNVTLSHVVKPREHTTILLPMIENILHDAGMNLTDLDGIVLGNGPGSFIGMRIAASVAQGMAYGANLQSCPYHRWRLSPPRPCPPMTRPAYWSPRTRI